MTGKEVVPINPEYIFCDELAQPVVIARRHTAEDFERIAEARAAVTDEQCGRYRECWMRPSTEPGCGARIVSIGGEELSAECPTGTMEPYRNCARRVLSAIVRQL